METIGFSKHDHHACIEEGLAAVEATCRRDGLQFTPQRRRVLEILLQEHRAMGAYEILDKLRAEGMGAQPPVAYRALDFLVGNGFAHKIERLNAFIACAHPGARHKPAFLICRKCDSVAEASSDAALKAMTETVSDTGFQIDRMMIEALGICPNCAGAEAT
ncbi:Fur family transcriptional regulator [Actibacterium ureilyticum]|uniref:Fur family transcriptional regulator n=1 Tax=Actibacterium ureilyticum TaxID=1590614 RepID=UPI000BAA99D0|nr:transcriptional repressor [Actibacterium ureilyticum]